MAAFLFAAAWVIINNVASLTQQLREKAFELGFVKVGIVPAAELSGERQRLSQWLSAGFHAEMKWMEREPETRPDPRRLMASARTVVVLAFNYFTPYEHTDLSGRGKISRYAWGDDYHDILKEKLRELTTWLGEMRPEAETKICVDSTPIMEKAWAVRAGIGWMGKHSNIITKEVGSWIFLSELLLNVELDYDVVEPVGHCGTCTACIEACPPKAIVAPYVVDAERCISYSTIELRDETLPAEVSASLDGWIYGCDICQDVCPWNRFEEPTAEGRFEPRHNETSVELSEIIEMSHDDYVERFRRSPMKRAKLAGLKRNAAALAAFTKADRTDDQL